MATFEIKHPLIDHKIGLLRNTQTSCKEFREISNEIASLLTFEATRNLQTEKVKVDTWCGEVEVQKLEGKKLTVVPILRAGIGMLDGVLHLIPNARISVAGLYRDEETLEPKSYYTKLTNEVENRTALIIDPMLATGGTLDATIKMLKQVGCKRIIGLFLLAAPEGIKMIEETHPDVDLYVGAIDQKLNEKGYILPGLGDAGDKIFATKI